MSRGESGGGSRGGGGSDYSSSSGSDFDYEHNGRRSGGMISNRSANLVLLTFLFLILLFGGGFMLFFPISNTYEFKLEEQETFLIDLRDTRAINLSVESGNVSTFFFNEVPPLSIKVQDNTTGIKSLGNDRFFYVRNYLKNGSEVLINWFTLDSNEMDFYIVQGEYNYEKWLNGSSSASEYSMTDIALENYTYSVATNDFYYFIWENFGNTRTINFTLDYTLTEYNVSNSVFISIGSFLLEDPQYDYMIIRNMAENVSSTVEYVIRNEPVLSYSDPSSIIGFIIFIGISILTGFLVWKWPQSRMGQSLRAFEKKFNKKFNKHFTKTRKEKDISFKKFLIFSSLIIFLIIQIMLFLEKSTWVEFLFIDISLVLFFGGLFLFIRWLINLPVSPKSRVLKDIEEMEEKGHMEYEKFERPINCTAYSIGQPIFSFLWGYLLIVLVYLQIEGQFSDTPWTVGFFISLFIFVDFIIIPAGIGKFRIDKIIVDPRNQTFIVKKNTLVFFYKKKRIFPWTDGKIHMIQSRWGGEKLKIYFSDDYQSFFKPSRDDYFNIIPKAFKALIEGKEMSKMTALKTLSMYDKKISRGRRICYSICISIAVIEIALLVLL